MRYRADIDGLRALAVLAVPIRARAANEPMMAALCALALVLGCVGIPAGLAHGYPGRLPASVQQLVRVAHDEMTDLREHRCLLFPD
jgi:hypothetical protein